MVSSGSSGTGSLASTGIVQLTSNQVNAQATYDEQATQKTTRQPYTSEMYP